MPFDFSSEQSICHYCEREIVKKIFTKFLTGGKFRFFCSVLENIAQAVLYTPDTIIYYGYNHLTTLTIYLKRLKR